MIDGDNNDDAIFDSAMEAEVAAGNDPTEIKGAGPSDGESEDSPADLLAATVESAKADAAAKTKPEEPQAPREVKFTAEEFLQTRERAAALEKRIAEIEAQSKKATDQAANKAGLFEDPEAWEAQIRAEAKADRDAAIGELRTQALNYDLDQTRSRVGDEKFAAMDKAVTEAAARDPQFAAQLKALSPYGAGAAIEKWYDATEITRDPTAYETRLREKIMAEYGLSASDGQPAGQKPATSAQAAGNVVKLPPSLARQSAARAATSADDGDDSEEAIWRAGANTRR